MISAVALSNRLGVNLNRFVFGIGFFCSAIPANRNEFVSNSPHFA